MKVNASRLGRFRSGYVPRLLGVLLGFSGFGYVNDSLGALLSRGSWTDVSTFTFVGELVGGLARGRPTPVPREVQWAPVNSADAVRTIATVFAAPGEHKVHT